MARLLIGLVAGWCLIFITVGCGTDDLATAPGSNAGATANPTATVAVRSTSASGTPSATSDQVFAQDALDYTRERGAVISGEPQVVLSRDESVADVAALGFGQWNFKPGCVVPMHIVIVKGDLDARGVIEAAIPPDQKLPVKYLVYVYDMNIHEIISTYGDQTGGVVKEALGDPTLPDPPPGGTGNPVFGSPAQPLPCTPTLFPPDASGSNGATPAP